MLGKVKSSATGGGSKTKKLKKESRKTKKSKKGIKKGGGGGNKLFFEYILGSFNSIPQFPIDIIGKNSYYIRNHDEGNFDIDTLKKNKNNRYVRISKHLVGPSTNFM